MTDQLRRFHRTLILLAGAAVALYPGASLAIGFSPPFAVTGSTVDNS
jgi:hypothetical protein